MNGALLALPLIQQLLIRRYSYISIHIYFALPLPVAKFLNVEDKIRYDSQLKHFKRNMFSYRANADWITYSTPTHVYIQYVASQVTGSISHPLNPNTP